MKRLLEKRDKPDPTAPAHQPDMDVNQVHKLLVSRWSWRPQPPSFTIQIPDGNTHSVLLWKVDERTPEPQPRWAILIAGDQSPVIHVPPHPLPWMGWTAVAALAGLAICFLIRHRRNAGAPR